MSDVPTMNPASTTSPAIPPEDQLRLGTVVGAMEALYPPELAESWDAVGLVCGDPQDYVRRIMVAIDPTEAVVDEALGWGADLLICHHPRLLSGVHGVGATTAAGRVIHRLIRGSCALYTAHTNADAADPGVADALAQLCDLTDLKPLQRSPDSAEMAMLVTYVPASYVDAVIDAAAAAGAGQVGDYRRCAFTGPGVGTYDVPDDGDPYIGTAGERGVSDETRIEMTLPASKAAAVVRAVLAEHPYEEPGYEIIPVTHAPRRTGIGRVGVLPEAMTLSRFAAQVARVLPASAGGVRVAGDLSAVVKKVAVCGGSGDSLLSDANASGADVYLTADLRHHRVLDHISDGGCALVDVSHWASEWPWCEQVARLLPPVLARATASSATSVEIRVSRQPTDPWTLQIGSDE